MSDDTSAYPWLWFPFGPCGPEFPERDNEVLSGEEKKIEKNLEADLYKK